MKQAEVKKITGWMKIKETTPKIFQSSKLH